MAQRVDGQCFHCKRSLAYEFLVPGEMLRPAIRETIKQRDPSWTPDRMICTDCLDLFRSEYVEDALKEEVGECASAGPVMPENWLRGQFNLQCARGTVGVFFTLSPTQPPAVQHLAFQKLASPGERMGAPTGAPAGVQCTP